MTDFASTIVIADWGQPHLVHDVLHGLVRNSNHAHKIIVMTSDPLVDKHIKHENLRCRDYHRGADGELHQRFESTLDFAIRYHDWLAKHEIEIIDCTSLTIEHRAKTGAEDGVDIAFKNNLGASYAKTEWILPNWDADMYPGPAWDEPLVAYAKQASPKETLIPTHVQPYLAAGGFDWPSDPWTTLRHCNSRLAMPTQNPEPWGPWVSELAWIDYCSRMRRTTMIREPAGQRTLLHWNPLMLRKKDFDDVGGYSYMGPGYDLELDTRMGRAGFTKVSPMSSFILHKGFVPVFS